MTPTTPFTDRRPDMTLSTVLFFIGIAPISLAWAFFICHIRRENLYFQWLSNGLFALGSWIWFISAAVAGDRVAVAIQGLVALWNTYLWWKNRHNRKKRKASLALGAKTRAIVEEMTAKLKPSPIPSPTGA